MCDLLNGVTLPFQKGEFVMDSDGCVKQVLGYITHDNYIFLVYKKFQREFDFQPEKYTQTLLKRLDQVKYAIDHKGWRHYDLPENHNENGIEVEDFEDENVDCNVNCEKLNINITVNGEPITKTEKDSKIKELIKQAFGL